MSRVTTNGTPVLFFTPDTDMNTIVVNNWILVDNISHFNDWTKIISVDRVNFTARVDAAMISTQKSTYQISSTDPASSSGGTGGGTSTNVIKRVTPYIGLTNALGNFGLGTPPSSASQSVKYCDDMILDLTAGKTYEVEIPIHIRVYSQYDGGWIMLIDKNKASPYTDYEYIYICLADLAYQQVDIISKL